MANTIDTAVRWLSGSVVTGPILGKELRVSSRRRRNHWLRIAYVLLLTLFLVLMWAAAVHDLSRRGDVGYYSVARLSEAGKMIVTTIVWFQFIATQLVAVAMLSTAISEEIHRRTLGVLMTTPITSVQVVAGKLLSKLIQLIILIAISLPVLAIVRVFGGVPWDYIISSAAIIFTAMLFAAAVSLFFSIFCKRGYITIILTILNGGFLYGLVPLGIAIYCDQFHISERVGLPWIVIINPVGALCGNTETLFEGTRMLWGRFHWGQHCLIMLGATAVVLVAATVAVRRAALRQVTGTVSTKKRGRKDKAAPADAVVETPLRRVVGAPLAWKESRATLFGKRKKTGVIICILMALMLGLTYLFCVAEHALDDDETHICYAIVLGSLGTLITLAVAGACISSEKEGRSWSGIVSSPLTNAQIIIGKFVGAVRRASPAWILLFGHLVLFIVLGFIHWLALPLMTLIVGGVVFLFAATGVYFSVRCRRSTTAVVLNLALVLALWLVCPLVMALTCEVADLMDEDVFESTLCLHPGVHAVVVMDGCCRRPGFIFGERSAPDQFPDRFYWPDPVERTGAGETLFVVTLLTGLNIAAGLLFLWRAGARLRSKVRKVWRV